MTKLIRTRTINTLIASAAACVLIAFLWSFSETGNIPRLPSDQLKSNIPEYYIINANTTQYDVNGLLDVNMESESIWHKPEDNTAVMKQPRFTIYGDGIKEWTVRSDLGTIKNEGEQVDLNQRVVIASSDRRSVLKTPQLSVYPRKKLAETIKPVTLVNPNGFTRSRGLSADLQQNTITLLSKVRGQYEAVQ